MAYWKGYAVALVSLLTGASVVHFIYRPDLVSLTVIVNKIDAW